MPGVACATLAGSSSHLSLSIRVWHAPHSLTHSLLTGCVAATLIITFAECAAATLIITLQGVLLPPLDLTFGRVCCCHPSFIAVCTQQALLPFVAKKD